MLSNLLSKLRNGQMAFHKTIRFRDIGFCTMVLDVLWDKGFIRGYTRLENRILLIYLLYEEGKPNLKRLTVLSKPTRRLYASCFELPRLVSNNGVLILSTTQGIMAADEAIQKRLGGELLAYFE
uniref:Ribosomal protein S8 n=1 Tax=Dictyopteris divaricata TaxID=156996 RepID=A0A4Y5T8Q7_9PHAE|nr:ribosomal protein S8 [Dictyopteris divaricata]QDB64111.1 ribosomal protein S8 [Dictyopteris divaricata]